MMISRKRFLILGVLLVFGACSRSDQFSKDQQYYHPEDQTYYNKSGKATERVESMGQPKKRIVVLDFWNNTPVKQTELGAFAADELRRGLFLSQRVILPPEVKSELTTEDLVQG